MEIRSAIENSLQVGTPDKDTQNILENSLFCIKTANEWLLLAKTTPTPEMLFGELWFDGEVCILFSDSNLGKSVLAVQIANSISTGIPINGFKLESKKQKVLYFDFELSKKQFEIRYSVENKTLKQCENHFVFDDNFLRIEIDPNATPPTEISFDNYLNAELEKSIVSTGAKILIIDNLTYLKTETERAKDALPLMKHLKALKNKYGLSILALAHTPKRDLSRPITQNDLAGSKMLYNFVDSCFAIGQSSKDINLKYLKQVKARNTAIIYHSENVIVCQTDKPNNFLEFEIIEYGTEREHLKEIKEKDRLGMIEQAKEMSRQQKTQREISRELGISLGAVNKYLKE